MNAKTSTNDTAVAVTVAIPCKNEEDNIGPLVDEIATALANESFEIIVVDDGSDDNTAAVVAGKHSQVPGVRLIQHDRSAGQSASIRSAIEAAKGEIVVTIDGDGQNNPIIMPELLSALRQSEKIGIAAGQRVGRKASFVKSKGSILANNARRWLLNDGVRDTGCGLKAVRRDLFLRLPYFDGWHRYLPALVKREGYSVALVDVVDRERQFGQSKYGIFDRLWVGIADLFGVFWLSKRRRVRPLVHEGKLK